MGVRWVGTAEGVGSEPGCRARMGGGPARTTGISGSCCCLFLRAPEGPGMGSSKWKRCGVQHATRMPPNS